MRNRFKKLINEELSVSTEVNDMCGELSHQLIDKISQNERKMVMNKNLLMYKGQIQFECSKWLKTIKYLKVIYVVYLLDSEVECDMFEKRGFMNCSADYQNKNIKLALGYVNGKPSRNFFSSISHELKHIYEYDRGMQKNENFYDVVTKKCQSKIKWERVVAWALYLSFNTEQDAFLSQYYEYLKTNKNYTKDPLADKENPYYKFDIAFDNVECLNINDKDMKASFGITVNQLYNILEAADDRLFKKMCHVWQKYNNDVNRSIRPNFGEFLNECLHNGVDLMESDIVY